MTLTWILAPYVARVYDLKAQLDCGVASLTFRIFYPNIFQHRHRFSISSTNFFLLHLNALCCLLLSDNRGMFDKCSGTCIVCSTPAGESLCSPFLQSCKKRKLSQAMLIPGTQGADHSPTTMQHPAEHTQNIILSLLHLLRFFICLHLASASEETLTTLEKGNVFLGGI